MSEALVIQLVLTTVSTLGAVVSLVIGIATHKALAVKIAGYLLILVCVICVIGYIAGEPSIYTFPSSGVGMALPTGICFGIIGACLIAIVSGKQLKD